jgi:hypothetical protein
MNNFEPAYLKDINTFVEDSFIDPRNALHGGRTEVFKTFYETKNEQELIFGFDISSQYPAVMALDTYAVGVKRSRNYSIEALTTALLNGSFCGLVKCDVECPKDLYVPLLPSKNDRKSLIFDLADKVNQTYASPELSYALENGYKITKLYNTYSYEAKTGIFKDYVACFYQMKITNTKHYTQEECSNLNKSFEAKGLNICIKSEDTCDNPGLRGVAKLFLNSLWGKFGTREIMTEYSYARSMREYYSFTSNDKIKVLNLHVIHDNLIEVLYERNANLTDPPDYVSPITAVFTTSNARVRLAKFMKILHPEQLFYCDTDSCYFRYDPNNIKHVDPRTAKLPDKVELGDGLGQWEMEVWDGKRWCATGCKCLGMQHHCPKNDFLKAKGITIDFNNKDIITFNNMARIAQGMNKIPIDQQQNLLNKKDLIKHNIEFIETKARFTFKFDKKNKDMVTYDNSEMTKIIQNTAGLKRYVIDNVTYPYGYAGEQYSLT